MQIPHTALSPEALQNLLEEFVTREGTDYGVQTYSLADKVRHVRRQVETGRAVILYDPRSSTCHIEVLERLGPDADVTDDANDFPDEQEYE
jgi:uncharacterized protein YheU (UPF0270 family)